MRYVDPTGYYWAPANTAQNRLWVSLNLWRNYAKRYAAEQEKAKAWAARAGTTQKASSSPQSKTTIGVRQPSLKTPTGTTTTTSTAVRPQPGSLHEGTGPDYTALASSASRIAEGFLIRAGYMAHPALAFGAEAVGMLMNVRNPRGADVAIGTVGLLTTIGVATGVVSAPAAAAVAFAAGTAYAAEFILSLTGVGLGGAMPPPVGTTTTMVEGR